MVQSLKEIVNCPDAEIYAMLRECNMDPGEAVQRLLTQDTFHEVKSKREKKKEARDIPDSRSRSINTNSSRVGRGGTDRGGHVVSNHYSSSDYGVSHGKTIHKKENGATSVPASLVSGSGTGGSNTNRRSTSEAVFLQNMAQVAPAADVSSLPQSSSGFQHSWSRASGQMSMADIVRMGKPQVKAPTSATVPSDYVHASNEPIVSNMSNQSAKRPPISESKQEYQTSQGIVLQHEVRSHEVGTAANHYNSHDNWSLVGQTSTGSGSTHPEIASASISAEASVSSSLLADESKLEHDPHLDESEITEVDVSEDILQADSTRSESSSEGEGELDNPADPADIIHPNDGPLNGMASYRTRHAYEHHEAEDVNEEISSAISHLQQLSLKKGELGAPAVDDNPAVIIPSHLQVTDADCSHLSFGSFGSGVNLTHPGSFSQNTLRSNLEMAPVAEDIPSDQLNSRDPEYYDDDQLKSALDENVTSGTSPGTRSYDMPSVSQSEIVRGDALDAAHKLQENFPSVSDYALSATTQATSTYIYPDSNSQMHNLSPFSSLMQQYTNSLPSSLLAPTGQPMRELEIPLSVLLANQSMSAKYNAAAPSMSMPMSLPEVKQEVYSAPQPTPQALPSSNIHNVGGPALPQHLLHPYSQPTLPLGHFANMIGYPFLPQSYTFLPSAAFPQAYTGSSPFHQSPAASMKYNPLPQYKSSISGGNLSQSPALPPGYGGFASSTNNLPGNFSLNPSTATATTAMGFAEALSSHYKEGSHFLTPQHNENSATWVHGSGSRNVSSLPGSGFYGFQGQQSQPNGSFRQVQQQQQQQQQPSQYAPTGYLNLYQSQGGPAQEQHHQQNPNEGNLNASQGPASHQIWQHGY